MGPGRKKKMYSYKEAIKLNDFEVFVSVLKFSIAILLFYRPFQYYKVGVAYGILIDMFGMYMVL